MAAIIVKLECITNMHVGNGDVNYNIIDNEVERDVVTNYPTVNASGVKGALREFFVKKGAQNVNEIFGSEKNVQSSSVPGALKFLGADMLAMPARASAGNKAYYLVASKESLENYQAKLALFLNQTTTMDVLPVSGEKKVEGLLLKEYVKIDDKEIYLVDDEAFRSLPLPVLARNKLDNGISKNLWYEEVVPYKSLFFFAVLAEEQDKAHLDSFKQTVDGQIVQFGGNASIGYGLCKVSVMEG